MVGTISRYVRIDFNASEHAVMLVQSLTYTTCARLSIEQAQWAALMVQLRSISKHHKLAILATHFS